MQIQEWPMTMHCSRHAFKSAFFQTNFGFYENSLCLFNTKKVHKEGIETKDFSTVTENSFEYPLSRAANSSYTESLTNKERGTTRQTLTALTWNISSRFIGLSEIRSDVCVFVRSIFAFESLPCKLSVCVYITQTFKLKCGLKRDPFMVAYTTNVEFDYLCDYISYFFSVPFPASSRRLLNMRTAIH